MNCVFLVDDSNRSLRRLTKLHQMLRSPPNKLYRKSAKREKKTSRQSRKFAGPCCLRSPSPPCSELATANRAMNRAIRKRTLGLQALDPSSSLEIATTVW